MTTLDKHAELAGRDFVNIFEEHSRRYCHVLRVIPGHYRTQDGRSVDGLVINEFTLGYDKGRKVRDVVGAWNVRADLFIDRHRQVDLGL